jgi:hypothetical protein
MSDEPRPPAGMPAHPDRADIAVDAPTPTPTPTRRRRRDVVLVVIVVAVVMMLLVLHLTGVVGPVAH